MKLFIVAAISALAATTFAQVTDLHSPGQHCSAANYKSEATACRKNGCGLLKCERALKKGFRWTAAGSCNGYDCVDGECSDTATTNGCPGSEV